MRRATSFDVAKLAGVTQPTVSRALRNLPGASPATRNRVRAAAEELGYVPWDFGRVMATKRSRRIAVVSAELTNPYYPQLVEPIRVELAALDLQAVVVTHTDRGPVGIDLLADGSYDGVILTTTRRGSTLPYDLAARGIPHVLVNRALDTPQSPTVTVDNAAGMELIAELLNKLGHREIALLAGPLDTSTGRERAQAFRAALGRRGISMPRHRVRRVSFDHDAGMAGTHHLLAAQSRPTAIVCGNDVIALGAMSAAVSQGLRVPADLTIIGFDDIAPASWPLVGLSTVHCDLTLLAHHAVHRLTAELTGATTDLAPLRLPVSLAPRRTHGPPPAVAS